jgi:hypothetical protein
MLDVCSVPSLHLEHQTSYSICEVPRTSGVCEDPKQESSISSIANYVSPPRSFRMLHLFAACLVAFNGPSAGGGINCAGISTRFGPRSAAASSLRRKNFVSILREIALNKSHSLLLPQFFSFSFFERRLEGHVAYSDLSNQMVTRICTADLPFATPNPTTSTKPKILRLILCLVVWSAFVTSGTVAQLLARIVR